MSGEICTAWETRSGRLSEGQGGAGLGGGGPGCEPASLCVSRAVVQRAPCDAMVG